jgi:Predicted integral membrane protein
MGRLARHRLFQVLVSLAVGAALLWLAIARIDLAGLGAELAQVRPGWLVAAVALYWIALMLRSWRWRILLAPVRHLSFGQVFHGLLVGYAANYLLPARLGELVRADFLGRRYASRGFPSSAPSCRAPVRRRGFHRLHLRRHGRPHSTGDSRIGPILHLVEVVAVGCVVLIILLLVLIRLRHKPLPSPIAFLEKRLQALAAGLHLITGAREVALLVAATAIVWSADTPPSG